MIAPHIPALVAGIEADAPLERRGGTRDGVQLLVTDRARERNADHRFTELPRLLRAGDLLVANDSATIPAALAARRADGSELVLHLSAPLDAERWIVEPRGPVTPGESVVLPFGGRAELEAPRDPAHPRLWNARLRVDGDVLGYLAYAGAPIRYRYVRERFPLAAYTTVFARVPGSAEMPSAGRPFTPHVLRALRDAGVELATVTLHCAVSSTELGEPPADERFVVSAETASAVNEARGDGRRVIAIGTTVVRALESSVVDGRVRAASGWTSRVVTPDAPPVVVDALLSGFHEPAASHVALLRAFVDDALLASAYAHARDAGYRWHEFGDVHHIA
jgi:S-adenosylmethionine:tRNA ribosyltransferase-isomerase